MRVDKITLHNMKFHGYHGCEEFEKQYGQVFEVDLDVMVDANLAGTTDCLTDAVNYVAIFESVKRILEQERHNLLERVAQRIAEQVLQEAGVTHFDSYERVNTVLVQALTTAKGSAELARTYGGAFNGKSVVEWERKAQSINESIHWNSGRKVETL